MEILYIKLGVFNEPPGVIVNRETLIKNSVKKKHSTSDGRAFKFIRTTTENGTDLLEATQVQVEEEARETTKRLSVVKMKEDLISI